MHSIFDLRTYLVSQNFFSIAQNDSSTFANTRRGVSFNTFVRFQTSRSSNITRRKGVSVYAWTLLRDRIYRKVVSLPEEKNCTRGKGYKSLGSYCHSPFAHAYSNWRRLSLWLQRQWPLATRQHPHTACRLLLWVGFLRKSVLFLESKAEERVWIRAYRSDPFDLCICRRLFMHVDIS